jgi:hypothetical protein
LQLWIIDLLDWWLENKLGYRRDEESEIIEGHYWCPLCGDNLIEPQSMLVRHLNEVHNVSLKSLEKYRCIQDPIIEREQKKNGRK